MKRENDITCEDFSKRLDNYEFLTDFEKNEMTMHASECEKCQSELDFYLSMLSTVRSLPKIEPPADFMDRLNERLDKEDRKAAPGRILYHIRRNGRQYAAAAACLALVTVLTANRGFLIDKFNGTHGEDGVVIDETIAENDTVSDNESLTAVTPIPRAEGEPSLDAPAENMDNRESKSEGSEKNNNARTAALPAASPAAAKKNASSSNSIPVKTAAAASSVAGTPTAAKTAQPSANVSGVGETTGNFANNVFEAHTENEPAEAANVSDTGDKASTAAADRAAEGNYSETERKKDIKADYSIALAGSIQSSETAAASSYDMRAEDVSASLSAQEVVSGYSLAGEAEENIAYGRYYRLDRDGNPMEDEDEPAAIGNLKISSSDADKAMDIINNCPHGENGGLYTTDSGNFALMLSMLSSEGVSYTNYTPGGDGNVQFRIVFN